MHIARSSIVLFFFLATCSLLGCGADRPEQPPSYGGGILVPPGSAGSAGTGGSAADAAADAPADRAPDTSADAAADTPADVAPDGPGDAGADASADVAPDGPGDAKLEAAPDAPSDTAKDVASEAPADSGADVPADSPGDVPQDTLTGPHRYALFVGSNYATTAELAAIDLDQPKLVGSLASSDQDTIAGANGGRGFLMHRTQGKVSLLRPSNPSVADFVVDLASTPDGGKPNPYAVVVNTGQKAYVINYGSNKITVIHLSNGSVKGEVDLGAFAVDSDGLVDAFDAVFDPVTARVYVGLQRIDQHEFGPAPDYVGKCTSVRAMLVGIDAHTDTVVDLVPGDAAAGLELAAVNPVQMAWDEVGGRVVLLGAGCAPAGADGGADAGTERLGRGVEAVTVASATSAWLWKSTSLDRPGGLVWVSPTSAIVGVDDASFVRHWMSWDPTSPSLGPELANVPAIPAYDGKGALVGLAKNASDAGANVDVVRYDLSAKTSSVITSFAFGTTGLMFASSAVVR
jgi:hypothetical protein